MMQHSKNADYIVSDKGIIILSKVSTDFPIVIQCNKKFGIVIYIADDMLCLRYQIDYAILDLKRMVLYSAETDKGLRWVLVIPALGLSLTPEPYANLFDIEGISQHQKFSGDDFPSQFQKYPTLAVITGFPE